MTFNKKSAVVYIIIKIKLTHLQFEKKIEILFRFLI